MKKRLLAVTAMAALVALAGCSTLQVNSDYDRAVDFTQYTTFDFLPAPEISNPLVYARVSEAVEAELVGKGLRREAGSAGLLVALHGRMSKQTQIDTTTYGYGWGGGWGYWNRWGYGGMGSATTTVREVPVGTLIVDLVDAKEKKMVWQGVASDSLDPNSSPEMKDYRVKNAVKKMFASFPPGTK
jgi:hypothetical protein